MPIKPENRKRYPSNWRELRARRLHIARERCEFCDVPNYAVGYRERDGEFVQRGQAASYAKARQLVYDLAADEESLPPEEQRRWIVVVLTIAHLDHNPADSDISRLRALCQRCHLRYDAQHHRTNAGRTRAKKRMAKQPVLAGLESQP
jgi:hypothetical protein